MGFTILSWSKLRLEIQSCRNLHTALNANVSDPICMWFEEGIVAQWLSISLQCPRSQFQYLPFPGGAHKYSPETLQILHQPVQATMIQVNQGSWPGVRQLRMFLQAAQISKQRVIPFYAHASLLRNVCLRNSDVSKDIQ